MLGAFLFRKLILNPRSFKNDIRNALGRLVNAVEHFFFQKLILNLRGFQNWYQKISRTVR